MQKVIKIFLTLIVAAGIFSCGGSDSDPAPVNSKFIDPGAVTNGTGTESSPYNTFAGITFEAGTSYLIKRGTVLYEQITVNASGTSSAPIIIGAYGTGEPPVIDGSELIDDIAWTDEGGSVYSCTLTPTELVGRGNVKIDGIIQNFVTTATPGSGEYTIDSSGKVQVYGDPSVREVRLSRRYFGIKGSDVSYIEIENLHIRQASLHGIHFEDSDNISVQNCIIEMCGGAYIGTLQAGNGVEFGNSSSNCTVSGCTVSEIFDSGVTCQTYDNNQTASDFTFSNNTISECGFAGVEVAVLRNIDKSGSSISDLSVNGNTITNCGDGFSGIRYGSEGRGIKIVADEGAGTISGAVVEQCTVETSEAGIFVSGNTGDIIISRCRLVSNIYGVAVYDVQASSTLKVKLSASLLYSNNIGFGFHLVNGSGNEFELYHNTFYDNTTASVVVTDYNGTPIIQNNIFFASADRAQIFSTTYTGYTITKNCIRECASFVAYGDIGSPSVYNNLTDWGFADNITTDPSFVDAPGADFDIADTDSPCYHTGATGTGVTVDYSGKNFESTPSIGAYEY